ncbi:MAG: DnaB-like helicase C-terminal domain-containing protein, partial [Muribaculaceae bacterium]|nr:DnaB-like helicase C-terminal domain-containing protein [Muribaculaceae bacterium]
ELNIPIIALSQLNRSTETREDKRPVLSDLRESGAIEQDADIVCFIHRPEYYTKSGEDAQGNDIRGLAELIVAKHRSGAVGDVKLRFVSKFAKFENWQEGYNAVRSAIGDSSESTKMQFQSKMNSDGNGEGSVASKFSQGGTNFSFAADPLAGGSAPDIMPDGAGDIVPF